MEGVMFGKPPKQEIDDKFIRANQEWKAGKLTSTETMKQIGMKKPTFYPV